MAKPSTPFSTAHALSTSVMPVTTVDIGHIWDVGIHGRGFMLSTLDQESPFEFRSYEVQSIPISKPRIDDADEPGEQTLFPWWPRAQHSWHEGAGQHVFDSPFSSRFRFCKSRGLDIWRTGEISLLKDTSELRNDAVDDHHLLAAENAFFYTHNGNVTRDPDPDAALETDEDTLATHSGTPINSITTDGTSLFAAFSGVTLGIKKTPLSGTLAWADVNALTAVDVIAFVKGRLMGAKGASIYEFDLASTTAPDPFDTHRNASWEWVAITEAGPAIYMAGHAGDVSEIYAARLTAQDIPFAGTATLGAMRSVWQAPEGEQILTIKGYLGKQVLIGTSRGIRVGTISTGEGDLEVTPLLTFGSNGDQGPLFGVKAIEPQLEWAWFAWTKFDGTYGGTGRLHLGELSWASDVMFETQGEILEIAHYNDRIYFVTDEGATSRIIKEHATDLEPEGWFRQCQIRFATTERKQLRYFDILTQGSGLWSLELRQNDGDFTPFTTDNATGGYEEEVVDVEATRFGVQVTLKRNPADATDGPRMLEWRLRAEPRVTGRFRYLVPVMIYDQVIVKNGSPSGYVGKAMEDLNHLMDLYRTDADHIFQGPESGVPSAPDSQLVKMEDLRFKEYAPPSGGEGFGGIALAIFREVR